jgi:hypothetical protein
LLPKPLRPHIVIRGLMLLSGAYFFMLGTLAVLKTTGLLDKMVG